MQFTYKNSDTVIYKHKKPCIFTVVSGVKAAKAVRPIPW